MQVISVIFIIAWVVWFFYDLLRNNALEQSKKELEVAYKFYRELFLKAASDAGYPEGYEKAAVEACMDRIESETDIRYNMRKSGEQGNG